MYEQTSTNLQRELQLTWSRMRLQSPHERLGLRPGVDREAVHDAFRELASRYHPDAFAYALSPEVTASALEVFLLVTRARDKVLRHEARQRQSPTEGAAPQQRRRVPTRTPIASVSPMSTVIPASPAKAVKPAKRPRPSTPSRSTQPDSSQHSRDFSRPTRSVSRAGLWALNQASKMYESLENTTHASANDLAEDLASEQRKKALQGLSERTSRRTNQGGSSSSVAHELHSTWGDGGVEETMEIRHAKLKRLKSRTRNRPVPPREFSETLSGSSSMTFSDPRTVLPTKGLEPDMSYSELPLDLLDAQQSFNVGWRAFKAGQVQEALDPLRKAAKADPHNPLFMTYYGYVLFLGDPGGQSRPAEKILRRALEAEDEQSQPDAHLFLGRILRRRGEKFYKGAMFHFREAMILNPHSEEARRDFEDIKRKHVDSNKPSTMRVIRRIFQR